MSGIPSASSSGQGILARYLPFAKESLWVFHYQRSDLPGDLIAGLVVAILLVPQSMAYALLAGLPPLSGPVRQYFAGDRLWTTGIQPRLGGRASGHHLIHLR
jgi:Sulfate permease and related transporters (MFS superfamily)